MKRTLTDKITKNKEYNESANITYHSIIFTSDIYYK